MFEKNKVLKSLEEKGVTKSHLLRTAQREIVRARFDDPITITEDQIKSAKHPNKKCKLCGKKGCDIKYVGFYFHKKCLRRLRKSGKEMVD